MLALVGCVGAAPRANRVIVAFTTGVMLVYATFGAMASVLGVLASHSAWVYAALAGVLFLCGLSMLIFGARSEGGDHLVVGMKTETPNLGRALLVGAASALVISPCCTPLVIAILGYTTDLARPTYGAVLLALFALGHAIPMALLGLGFSRVGGVLNALSFRQPVAIATSILMIVLGLYYGALV